MSFEKIIYRFFYSILLLNLILINTPYLARAADLANPPENLNAQIEIHERARNTFSKQIEQYNAKAREKAEEAQSLLGQITNLRQKAQMAEQKIAILELRNKQIKLSIQEINQNIFKANTMLDNSVKELRLNVINVYKYGSQEELNLLFSSKNAHDAITTAYMMNRVSMHNQNMIDELVNSLEYLEQSKLNISKSRELLDKQSKELYEERKEYSRTIAKTNSLFSDTQKEKQKAEKAAREMQKAQQEVGQKIISLISKKKKIADAPPKSIEKGVAAPLPQPQQNYTYMAKGSRLDWPITGSIIAPFGSRTHSTFKTTTFNSGIDIRAASGAPVKAAAPGEVLFNGWIRGFGQVVIIDHGNNLSTVYAHLASAKVEEGSAVKSGTIIGTVGNTGATSDYSLHFEVRVGDTAKNPLEYLKRY